MLRFKREGNKMIKYITNIFKVRPGLDRFFLTLAFFFVFCHFVCCVWYMQAEFNIDDPSNWIVRNDLLDADNFVVSLFCLQLMLIFESVILLHFIILLLQY